MKILQKSFYNHPTVQVAKDLLGKNLVREIEGKLLIGKIVETEAYTHDDPASHAYKGERNANKSLFGPVGHAYVYFTYGNHFCFNVVAKVPNVSAGGVLIRALEPIEGIEIMQELRPGKKIKDLTNGPGKLTQAFAITKELNGIDLMQKGPLYLTEGEVIPEENIVATKRIGISRAQDKLWRFCIEENQFVSR